MVQQLAGVKVVKPNEAVLDPATGVEWAISPDTTGSKTLMLGVAKAPPGVRLPAHYHPTDGRAPHSGAGRVSIRGETRHAVGDGRWRLRLRWRKRHP